VAQIFWLKFIFLEAFTHPKSETLALPTCSSSIANIYFCNRPQV